MRAVRYLIGRWPLRRRVGLVALVVLAAGSLGFVMLAALGAHRADGAWERLEQRSRNDDLFLDVADLDAAKTVASQVVEIPGVRSVSSGAYAYVIPEGQEQDFFGGVIIPLERGILDTFWRPVLTDGRLPRADRADEVVVNARFLRATGKTIGDRVRLTDLLGLIRQEVTIVGVGTLPLDFTYGSGSPLAYPSLAFTTRWMPELRQLREAFGPEVVAPGVLMTADRGVGDDELLRRVTAVLSTEEIVGLQTPTATAETVTDTLELQRNAFALVAVVSGLATLAVLALVLAQVTSLRPVEVTALRSIGLDRAQRRLAVALPGAVVGVLGVLGGAALTVALEGLVPTGLAGDVDVGRDLGDDVTFLVAAVVLALALVAALVVGLAWRSTAEVPDLVDRRRPVTGLVTSPAVTVGLRAAGGGMNRRGRRQAGAALVAVLVGVVGAAATGIVVGSRDRLLREPGLSGVFFDVQVGTYRDTALVDEDRAVLLGSSRVAAVATIDTTQVRVDGLATQAIAVTADEGRIGVTVLEGRPPVRSDELAVTPSYLRRLDKDVGDRVKVDGADGDRTLRIVGTVALPFAAAGSSGEQVALTAGVRDDLGLASEGEVLVARLRDPASKGSLVADADVDVCLARPVLGLLGVDALPGAAAAELTPCVALASQRVLNLDELGAAPTLLVAFLGTVAIAGLAYFLGASLRRTARDLGILRVLGFTRRQAATSMLVQAGTVALVGAVAAVPLGLVLGRAVWRAVTDNLGVVERTDLSTLGTVGAPVAAVLVALVLAVVPIVLVLRQPATAPLRAE